MWLDPFGTTEVGTEALLTMRIEVTKEPPKKVAPFAVTVGSSHRTPKLVRTRNGESDSSRSRTSRGSFPGTYWTHARTALGGSLSGGGVVSPVSNPTTGGSTGGPASARCSSAVVRHAFSITHCSTAGQLYHGNAENGCLVDGK